MKNTSQYLLSLFSGCGGLDWGFHQAGFTTALAYDKREDSLSSWNRNFTSGMALNRDIWKLDLLQMDRDYGGIFAPSGVIGGPPCQGFSVANRNGHVNDPRNQLVKKFFNLALALHRRNPLDFIMMENVPAIMGARGGGIVEKQILRLRRAGFITQATILDAAQYGVPQFRRRLIVVAINKAIMGSFKWPTPTTPQANVTVRKAFLNFPEPVHCSKKLNEEDIPFHPNHVCMVPRSKKFFTGELVEGFAEKRSFRTLSWDKPSYTASYGNREVHVHPNGHRRLSMTEALILQGFPMKYVLNGSLSSQVTQISEAVPPPLAFQIAKSISN
ncbi:MAG: DNA cytosine methyltransferase, partial [Rhizobiales bacterium]|nr:DNA cytosine methyltransferase [Hyphomicrobiales bacterium]